MYMIIVGEKINTSRKSIADAVKERDAEFIGEVARRNVMPSSLARWHGSRQKPGPIILTSTPELF
jgi:hypothetical protein